MEKYKVTTLFDVAKHGKEFIFSSAGRNWIGYLHIRVVWPYGRMRVYILKHWHIHKDATGHPRAHGRYEILENTKRIACAVILNFDGILAPQTCAVENPLHTFEYWEKDDGPL